MVKAEGADRKISFFYDIPMFHRKKGWQYYNYTAIQENALA